MVLLSALSHHSLTGLADVFGKAPSRRIIKGPGAYWLWIACALRSVWVRLGACQFPWQRAIERRIRCIGALVGRTSKGQDVVPLREIGC